MTLPAADIRRRPVYDRMLRRAHHMPLEPPSDAERLDAVRILRDTWEDDLTLEAFRIFEEASRE